MNNNQQLKLKKLVNSELPELIFLRGRTVAINLKKLKRISINHIYTQKMVHLTLGMQFSAIMDVVIWSQ